MHHDFHRYCKRTQVELCSLFDYFKGYEVAANQLKTFYFSRHTTPGVTLSPTSWIDLRIYITSALQFPAKVCRHFIGLQDFIGNMSTWCYLTGSFPTSCATMQDSTEMSWMRLCSHTQLLLQYSAILCGISKPHSKIWISREFWKWKIFHTHIWNFWKIRESTFLEPFNMGGLR